VIEGSLYVSIRSYWLIVLLGSSLFLLIFFLEILSVAEKGVLQFPTIALGVLVFPLSSINFVFSILKLCYLVCIHFRISMSSLWIDSFVTK
jgi:hypothetical protein